MLMTAMRPPTEVTPHGEKLLQALRSAREWMNRKAIAHAIGKRRLTPYDLALLELLVSQGKVEVEKRDYDSVIPYQWVYRAK